MPYSEDYTVDVDQSNFEAVVLQAPEDLLVVVDFWAPWCAPCRTLGPVLEKVAAESEGKVLLAKVNVDENPALAAPFGVQGIPAVRIFKAGRLVGQFTGAQPEPEVRRALEPFLTTRADDISDRGHDLMEEGRLEEADASFQKALEEDPRHAGAKLGLAMLALKRRDAETAEALAKSIDLGEPEYEAAQGLLNQIGFQKESGGVSEEDLRARIEADEKDLDARYALACLYAAQERYPEALEAFLAVLKKNKAYREGAAKTAMVKVFSIIGQRSSLADEYRDKMEWILY